MKLLYIFITSEYTCGYVFYTYPQPKYIYTGKYFYGSKLIQTRTEPLRNKQVFIEYFYLESAIFILIFVKIINKNPPFLA